MAGTITYRGVNRRGVAVTGRTTGPAAALCQLYFNAGFRELTVERDGVQVGRIERNADGERAWWAES